MRGYALAWFDQCCPENAKDLKISTCVSLLRVLAASKKPWNCQLLMLIVCQIVQNMLFKAIILQLLTFNAKDVSKNAQFSIISFDFGCRNISLNKHNKFLRNKQERNLLKFVFSKKAKNTRNLHRRFDTYYILSNRQWRFCQFLWPS